MGPDGATGGLQVVDRDQGLRDTHKPVLLVSNRCFPTAFTPPAPPRRSPMAAAVLWMSEEKAKTAGLRPRARVLAQVLVGSDPYYQLDGPIVATAKVLAKAGLTIADIDIFEVNEAFASVVCSCRRSTVSTGTR